MNAHNARTAALLLTGATAVGLCSGCSVGAQQPTRKDTTAGLPQGDEQVQLDPAEFSTTIDNPYWPMVPGTRWTFSETDAAGAALTVVVTVTSDTKLIANGVTARVVRDTVWDGEAIVEDTFDWYAQDASGSIWYLGEDTAEFQDGAVVSTEGSFEAGVDGALPGIAVPADPQLGMAYRQEYYRGEAEDNGEVLSVREIAEVPAGQYSDVLLTKDTNTIELDVLEYKLYVPGVGPVLTLDIAGGSGGREALISVEQVPDGAGTGPLGQPD